MKKSDLLRAAIVCFLVASIIVCTAPLFGLFGCDSTTVKPATKPKLVTELESEQIDKISGDVGGNITTSKEELTQILNEVVTNNLSHIENNNESLKELMIVAIVGYLAIKVFQVLRAIAIANLPNSSKIVKLLAVKK